MFKEIKFLKENLETELRGDAVRDIKGKIQEIIEAEDWKSAEDFFWDYSNAFNGDTSVLNIVSTEFQTVIDKLIALEPDFNTIILMNNLKGLHWFENIEDSSYKKGYISEHMADFGQGIAEIAKLQEARKYYRRAHRDDDTARVQERLSQKVKSFTWAPTLPRSEANPAIPQLQEKITEILQRWQDESNENKMRILAEDVTGIRPQPYQDVQAEGGDIYLAGFLEQLGVIETVSISSDDGRVNSGEVASSNERIHFNSHELILTSFLKAFEGPVKEWLLYQEDEVQVCQYIGGSLKTALDWNNDSTKYFMEGMAAWMEGYPHVALSFWLPFFESALRNKLGMLGEDIINPQPKPGIEDFIMFDNLLKKADNHYNIGTVEYWRMIFSTSHGLGWNLRNAFCHGVLPVSAMKVNIYTLAVFLAYLFLLHTKENAEEE